METPDEGNSMLPEKGSTRIKKCSNCGAEKKQVFVPEEKQYMEFMKREMIVENAHWAWEDIGDSLSEPHRLCNSCIEQSKRDREIKEIQQEAARKRDEKVKTLGGELNFKQFTLDKYNALSPSQVEAYKACLDFDPDKHNLFLVGEAGVGKTHLATAALNAKYQPGSKRYRITELLRHFRIKRAADEEQSLIDEFSTCPILVIEDFGVQKTTDWSIQMWWEILDRRIEAGRNGLIVTSNAGRKKIAEQMGDKISSRMSGICRVIKIEGLDLRVTRKPTDS